jgi:hypothetical protein
MYQNVCSRPGGGDSEVPDVGQSRTYDIIGNIINLGYHTSICYHIAQPSRWQFAPVARGPGLAGAARARGQA